MTRIDTNELEQLLQVTTEMRDSQLEELDQLQLYLEEFNNEADLKGDAISSTKNYYRMTYFPILNSTVSMLNLIVEKLTGYIRDFYLQVDGSGGRLDSNSLMELEQKITSHERDVEDLKQRLSSVSYAELNPQITSINTTLFDYYKQQDILNKYLQFEQDHASFFEDISELAHNIQNGLQDMANAPTFSGIYSGYDTSKLNKNWQLNLAKERIKDYETGLFELVEMQVGENGKAYAVYKNGVYDEEATKKFLSEKWNDDKRKFGMAVKLFFQDEMQFLTFTDPTTGETITTKDWLISGAWVLFPIGKVGKVVKIPAKFVKNSKLGGKAVKLVKDGGGNFSKFIWGEGKGIKKVAEIGDDFGKMGKLVKHPNIAIDWKLYADHGTSQLLDRGITNEMADLIVKNGKVLEQAGGNKFAFITTEGVIVVSKEGKLVTGWSKDYYDQPMNEILEKLFGK